MKLSNYAILFTIIFILLYSHLSVKVDAMSNLTELNQTYNQKLDTAAFDAARGLVEYDSTNELSLNKDEAVSQFFRSLYASFGVSSDKDVQERLQMYVPIMLITDIDGFYVCYSDSYEVDGYHYYTKRWSEKIPYSVKLDDGYIYQFNLGDMQDYVRVFDTSTNVFYEGHRKDVEKECDAGYLGENFDILRRTAIIEAIQSKMEYYINIHNRIAQQYGIVYSFYLPIDKDNAWIRTVDDISFLFVFQGYPYGTSSMGYYNRVSFAGARITKSSLYYVNKVDGILYYHKDNCPYLDSYERGYSSKEDSASLGAYPCPHCKP